MEDPQCYPLRNRAAGQWSYPNSARLRPEARSMIDDQPLLVLPLVHHLVQQRVQRLLPPVAPDMPPADDYLRLAPVSGRAVVAQPALHPARDAEENRPQRAAKSLAVVRGMPA